MSKKILSALQKLLCIPLILLLAILTYPRQTFAIILLAAAGIMGVRVSMDMAQEVGRLKERKALTSQIRAIRNEQLRGFQERARQSVKNIECGEGE